VIIDDANGLVYRYPRHQSAAAKLSDEVTILAHLNKKHWAVPIPYLIDYDGNRASYRYIDGDVLDNKKLATLSDKQLEQIGGQLGIFLAELHVVDPKLIEHKAWRQPGSLFDYYKKRIEGSDDHNKWKQPALKVLNKLQELRQTYPHDDVVVHGDLHGLNTVVATDGNKLAGVIDLSEIELGDPHQDFRKIFMTDERLLNSALLTYEKAGGQQLSSDLIKTWAYVNEWANLCYFADQHHNPTYQRAHAHLKRWGQI
jgi:aminoglycoside phosphotransferase (APT) family kinase protein